VGIGDSGSVSFFDGTLTAGGLRGGVAMFLQYDTEQMTKKLESASVNEFKPRYGCKQIGGLARIR
jgi:hypothetical protein